MQVKLKLGVLIISLYEIIGCESGVNLPIREVEIPTQKVVKLNLKRQVLIPAGLTES